MSADRHPVDRPDRPAAEGGGISLIALVLSGALRITPPEGGRAADPSRDD